jgi:N-acetylgalactosamine-6-sulfatase
MALHMNRRTFVTSLGASLAGLHAAPRRPNVVIILADDMGFGDVSMHGCPDIKTPHIDSIARQGVRFTQFYDNAPECSPTRCSLLTGRYQQRVGGLECAIGVNNVGRYDEAEWLQKRGELGLPLSEITMARIFKDAGYDTACIGKWHLGYGRNFSANRHGFDEYFGILGGNADYFTHEEAQGGGMQLVHNGTPDHRKGYLTDLFTEASINWLKARRSNPFLLYLPYNAPHTPIQDPDAYDPKTGTAPERQRQRPVYCKMVARLDQRIGDVLRQLDAMGAAENTLLFFLSDNGADANGRNLPYRGGKSTVFEGGIRVPCCVRWPGVIPQGKTVDQVALTMDILPTMIAAAGVPSPRGRRFDGIDLLPHMKGRRPASPRTVFWRYKRAQARRKAVRSGDWKYINDSGKEMLFQIARDETEKNDLLSQEPRVAQDLKTKLAAWEKEVQAPRLRDFRPPA